MSALEHVRPLVAQVKASYTTAQSSAETLNTMISKVGAWKWADHEHMRGEFDAAFQKATLSENRVFSEKGNPRDRKTESSQSKLYFAISLR